MKNLIFIIFFLNVSAVNAQSSFKYTRDFNSILVESRKPNSKLAYESLWQKYSQNINTLSNREMLSMMIGFTDKPNYKPYAYYEMQNSLENKSKIALKSVYIDASNFADELPFSLSLLNQLLFCSKKLDMPEDAARYSSIITKVSDAMRYSGDGSSADKAIFILEPSDANYFLSELTSKGYTVGGKTNIEIGGYKEVYDYQKQENGAVFKIYFNLQHANKINLTKVE